MIWIQCDSSSTGCVTIYVSYEKHYPEFREGTVYYYVESDEPLDPFIKRIRDQVKALAGESPSGVDIFQGNNDPQYARVRRNITFLPIAKWPMVDETEQQAAEREKKIDEENAQRPAKILAVLEQLSQELTWCRCRPAQEELEILRTSVARIAQAVGVDNELQVKDQCFPELSQTAKKDRGWNDLAGLIVDTVFHAARFEGPYRELHHWQRLCFC